MRAEPSLAGPEPRRAEPTVAPATPSEADVSAHVNSRAHLHEHAAAASPWKIASPGSADGDGSGDDYNEILPGDVNSTEAGDAWRKLGIFLKREMPNQSAFVLSGDPSISREIYMRASRKHVLGIGGVDTRLLRYDILPPKPKKADF